MADVFISYKREERARVERIARSLQELGLSVWFDASLEGGQSFHAQINQEARASKTILVCWTPAAVNSEWVIGEAEIGRARGVLAPVFLAPADLPPPFNTLHAFGLQNWSGDHGNTEWLALLDRIGPLVGRAGLRHLALALAAGEPVRMVGENVANVVAPRQVAAAPRRGARERTISGRVPPKELDAVPLRRVAWGLAVASMIVLSFGVFFFEGLDGLLRRLVGPAMLVGAGAGLAFAVLGRRRVTVMSVLLALTAAGPAFFGLAAGFALNYVLFIGLNVGADWAYELIYLVTAALSLAAGCGYAFWLGRHLRTRAAQGRRGFSAAETGFALAYVLVAAAIWGSIERSIDAAFALFLLVLSLAGAAFHIAGRSGFRIWSLLGGLIVSAFSALLAAYVASVFVSLLAHAELALSPFEFQSYEHLALQLLAVIVAFCFTSYRVGVFQAERAMETD